MICEQIQPKLYLMADGELPEDEIEQVETHLTHCQHCTSLHDRLLLENQSLSDTLAVRNLQENKIRYMEKRVLQYIAPPLHVVIIDSGFSLLDRLLLIVTILISYAVMRLLPLDTAAMYEKITKSLATSGRLSNLVLNIAIVIFMATFIAVLRNCVNWLSDRITKGGLPSCS